MQEKINYVIQMQTFNNYLSINIIQLKVFMVKNKQVAKQNK